MPDTRLLRNVIQRRVALGQSRREIFKAIKTDYKFFRTPDARIDSLIAEYRLAYNDANRANNLRADQRLRDAVGGAVRSPRDLVIGYSFTFQYPPYAKSKNRGMTTTAHFTIDGNSNMTKREIRAAMMLQIDAWILAHYQTANRRQILASLQFTSIQKV